MCTVARAPSLTRMEVAALRSRTDLFETVAAAVRTEGNLTAPDLMVPMNAAAVSENILKTPGLAPVLVAAQLAFSVVLLVGAGLMARAFVNLRTVSLGFDPHGAISMSISLAGQRWDTDGAPDA